MPSLKVCKPTAYTSTMAYIIFTVFLLVLLFSIFGFISVIIDEIARAQQLSLSLRDTIFNLLDVTLLFIPVPVISISGMLLAMMINLSIYFNDQGFQMTSFFIYKSKWFTWEKVVQVRMPFGLFALFLDEYSIVQIGIDGLGGAFKLSGLLFWMYPYGAINLGDKRHNAGKFFKTLKQQRPELFSSN